MPKKSLVMLATALVFVLVTPHALADDPPGTSTGKKIGTIIKSAIDTSLPGVTTILDLIWNHKPAGGDSNKMKKDELQKAIDDAKKELQDKFTAEAQKKVEPLKDVSDELAIVNKFLRPSSLAYINVVQMRTRLTGNDSPTDPIWNAQKSDWSVVKKQLQIVSGVKDDLQKINDLWLRDKLTQIRGANDDLVVRIDDAMTQKNIPELKDRLKDLTDLLQNMTAVVGYELEDFQVGMDALAKWAKGGQGDEFKPSAAQIEYRRLLDEKYPRKQ